LDFGSLGVKQGSQSLEFRGKIVVVFFTAGVVSFEYSAERVLVDFDYEARLTACTFAKLLKAVWPDRPGYRTP